MDSFASLPDELIENILSYCPFVDRVRSGRINQRFRSISIEFLGASTKILTGRQFPRKLFSKITDEQLTQLLETCKYRLEEVKFRLRTIEDGKKLAKSLSRVEFPNLIKIIVSSKDPDDMRMMDPLAVINEYDDESIDMDDIVMCGDDMFGAGATYNGDSWMDDDDDEGEMGQNSAGHIAYHVCDVIRLLVCAVAEQQTDQNRRTPSPIIDDQYPDGIDGETFEEILRHCPKLRELAVSCLSERFVLSSTNTHRWMNIEHLRLGNVYETAFRSMIGRFPNLLEFVCDMRDCPTTESIDDFCAFIPRVEILRLFPTNPGDEHVDQIANGELGKIKFRNMHHIWRLHSLRCFRLAPHPAEYEPRNRCVNVNDQELTMMARAFPRLESFVLEAVDQLTYEGFRAIVSLRELRRMEFVESPQVVSEVLDLSGTRDRLDPMESTKLIWYRGNGLLCPSIFSKFVAATCETLEYFGFDGIRYDGDSEENEFNEMAEDEIVAEMIRSVARRLSRCPRRSAQSTTIQMRFVYAEQIAVWRSERVVAELDELKANCGVELKLLNEGEDFDEVL